MNYVLGVVVFAIGIIFTSLVGLDYNMSLVGRVYIDALNIFAFSMTFAAVIIATRNFKVFITSVNALLSKKYHISAADKENGIKLFKLLGKTSVYASVLITVMALMAILLNLSEPAMLGPKISLALNSIVMGTFINLILINPAVNILQARYNSEEKTVISERQVIDKLLELCYKQGISPEDILEANEIYVKKQ